MFPHSKAIQLTNFVYWDHLVRSTPSDLNFLDDTGTLNSLLPPGLWNAGSNLGQRWMKLVTSEEFHPSLSLLWYWIVHPIFM